MYDKEQYIEPLIKLIEINEDKTWLPVFLDLRSGGTLPGGGAGSLNDWGPIYSDRLKNTWYSELYAILRYLFDYDLPAVEAKEFKRIQLRNNCIVIRCLNCNKSYQHPSIFESHVALDFYHRNFDQFAENKLLMNLFVPELTYEDQKTKEFRVWLAEQYDFYEIKVYDFLSNDYICPYCGIKDGKTEHDLYLIIDMGGEQKSFKRLKKNANWGDSFETVYTYKESLNRKLSWWQKIFNFD